MRPDGTVKVLDFGLAKALAPEGAGATADSMNSQTLTARATQFGVILGTAAYMSPEQARGKAVDRRTDLWSFGCVLYELLTAKPAFSGETLTDIVAAVMKNDPDFDTLAADTPPGVRLLLRRSLEKDPGRRLQHAGDARIEIHEALTQPEARSPAPPTAMRRSATARLFPWTLVVVLAASSAYIASRPSAPLAPVVRLDLNMPAAIENGATTNSPNFAISADGTRIAYAGTVGGLRRLYVRKLDEADSTVLRGTDTVNNCFFSPDGRSIGFITSDRILKKISLADGLVTNVVTDADNSAGGGVWDADDRIVFVRAGSLWDVAALRAPRSLS